MIRLLLSCKSYTFWAIMLLIYGVLTCSSVWIIEQDALVEGVVWTFIWGVIVAWKIILPRMHSDEHCDKDLDQ